MARYRWEATVPPATAQEDAVEAQIEVDDIRLQDGLLFAPPGTAGTVFGELLWGETRLLPTTESTARLIPDTTDPAPLDFTITSRPYTLKLRVWAPAATKSHTITARVDATALGIPDQEVSVVSFEEPPVRPATDNTDTP